MRTQKDVLIEALVVGLSTVVMGLIISAVIGGKMKPELPTECSQWNKYHMMEVSLFLIGFFLHIAYEAAGANEWYSRRYMKQIGEL